jgi:hypothetical protein
MKSTMNAKRLRLVLIVTMLLILIAATAGFVFAQQYLAAYATSISKLNADAQSGDKNLETLSNLETKLAQDAELIERTRSVVADNATYGDQFLNDISRIAAEAGVTVTGIEFVESTAATPAAGAATTTPTPQASATPTPSATTGGGVTKKSIQVSIQSPLNYTKMMNFLKGIETNALEMQVSSVSLSKDKGDDVSSQGLTIGVYVR